ncbi:endo-1,4-beta-xylanase [Saccharopolyspora rhizosphaerae]|uniref:Beta-xylanase n=1 Tax=Saccharopolyspora rhizosphaerae TaxID=2492662 RepID=A0A3R8P8A6_9PSEU|nr:endo-1,4-beta-xylanase [Saccharopolyspora rhizosphaerae]RRO18877.1 endo-1,4-beta-xylanase [Saccharopolyspora rhizosphaerae]
MKPLHLAATAVAAVMLLPVPAHAAPQPSTLRDAAPDGLVVGSAAAGGGHHEDQPYPDPISSDQAYRDVLGREFSSLSPENQMKWEYVRPTRETYDFAAADAIVDFAAQHGQVVRGHTLLWHSQNPEWLENGNFSAEELRAMLREHIHTVVGRYAGRVQQWDVANEIFDESGTLRTTENIWIRELGPGIIADAFRWAHEADPNAKLFFNDYGVESDNAKSDAYYALIQDLLAQGVPVHGFSAQAHLDLDDGFPADLAQNLRRFADLGLDTAITELDVRMTLPQGGAPTEQQLAEQADFYRRALQACLDVSSCHSFTVWGLPDKYSWVPGTFPDQGAATIYWDDFTPKPAHHALLNTLSANASGRATSEG